MDELPSDAEQLDVVNQVLHNGVYIYSAYNGEKIFSQCSHSEIIYAQIKWCVLFITHFIIVPRKNGAKLIHRNKTKSKIQRWQITLFASTLNA